MKLNYVSKKNILIVINSVLVLMLFCIHALADNQIHLDVLSPKLNLDKFSFGKFMINERVKLIADLESSSQKIGSPYEVFGQIRWQIKMNNERLIIRELVKKHGAVREVHYSLSRIQDDGTEQFLGQCRYRINRNYAILAADASNMQLPAFKIKEQGNNYGTVLFAAVLESARDYEVNYFYIKIAWTSIYERFGFKETEFGMLDELYKIIKPNDPAFLNTAINLSKERGIMVSFTPEPNFSSEKLISAQTILSREKFIVQSI